MTRTTIAIQGAREHNLKDVTLEIPRDRLVIVTGLSGSGKSSLAFDTVYAEGQRRYMESLSAYAKRFVEQIRKPNVDFVFGLSPVISIDQKTITANPRSTVGTMTDISNYLNLLFATMSTAHCPFCREEVEVVTPNHLLERAMALGDGATVEIRAPVYPVYGEDHEFLFTELRRQGYRHVISEGETLDMSSDIEVPVERLEVVCDRLTVRSGGKRQLLTAIRDAIAAGENFVKIPGVDLGCRDHGFVASDLVHQQFMFNNPNSACRTCSGLGTYLQAHLDLLVPDKRKTLREGCFVRWPYDPDSWFGRLIYSVCLAYGIDLDVPFHELPSAVVDVLLHGTRGRKVKVVRPPGAQRTDRAFDTREYELAFEGIQGYVENAYRRYREREEASGRMDAWLKNLMVEKVCPACHGTRLRPSRDLFTIGGNTIAEIGNINFAELRDFLDTIELTRPEHGAARQILNEITARLELLLGIGLDYLNFNRRSRTLSGGEAQRIRLSTQIGSGLMGMLYVLDEPTIGLHPKDGAKMIATLRRLRDLGNSVLVVEHDEDTIRAADHLIEMGPGAGVHGGEVVVDGTLQDVLTCDRSPTGLFLSGRKEIPVPATRRPLSGRSLVIRGARENNLQGIDVTIPLGVFVCVTGVSGSGKSSMVNDILYKRLTNLIHDPRQLYGAHDRIDGIEHVHSIINIDQSPIGRTPRSNPATYCGFYDSIRDLFAATELARSRGYGPGRFSFNVKSGRCAECAGEGTVLTRLHFMPDVETQCDSCKGARFNAATLEVTYKGKSIAEVLDLSIEEALGFFEDHRAIRRKLDLLDQLGLGYLTIGQSSTTLSGGEAQRVKLATELAKSKRGGHRLYVLDEPTTGMHLADIERLLDCLNRLVTEGHTVLVIEHHMDVIKQADHVIDLGPDGGHAGGEVIAAGTPEHVAASRVSHTGRFLRDRLGNVT